LTCSSVIGFDEVAEVDELDDELDSAPGGRLDDEFEDEFEDEFDAELDAEFDAAEATEAAKTAFGVNMLSATTLIKKA
jgi:hypothetical protein